MRYCSNSISTWNFTKNTEKWRCIDSISERSSIAFPILSHHRNLYTWYGWKTINYWWSTHEAREALTVLHHTAVMLWYWQVTIVAFVELSYALPSWYNPEFLYKRSGKTILLEIEQKPSLKFPTRLLAVSLFSTRHKCSSERLNLLYIASLCLFQNHILSARLMMVTIC